MDTEKCAALLCALEEGTLARAADKLGYTPSGISRMVAALEGELGFPLLRRGRSGVSATAECQALLPALRQMVYQAENCRQTAAALRGLEQGRVTVGANYRFYARQLAHLMARFREKHPGIQFQTIEGTSTALAEALREHRADLCVISRRDGPHQWLPLRRDEMMVMLSPDHPLERERPSPTGGWRRRAMWRYSPAGRRTTPAFWRKTAFIPATSSPEWRTIFPLWPWWRRDWASPW